MAENEKEKEPQSYGADKGWVSGKTGGTVDNQPQKSEGGDDAFYNPRHDNEVSTDFQGGRISPEQFADNAQAEKDRSSAQGGAAPTENDPQQSGAQRDSYFRERDYNEK